MSKDPAFLFYPSDFLSGTMLMTDEQVGRYMRVICYEHQNGHISEEDMLKICKTYDKDIFKHFKTDKNGLYYNIRLEEEIERRSAYSASRSANRKTKQPSHVKHMNKICKTYVKHMEDETITENEDENITNDISYEKTFAEFWKAYPKKTKPMQAERFWSTLLLTQTLVDKIMQGVEKWKQSGDWKGGYIQDPVNWLRDGQYEADPPPPKEKPKQNFAGTTYTDEQTKEFEDDPEELIKQYKEERK
jgi:hypothetical protein